MKTTIKYKSVLSKTKKEVEMFKCPKCGTEFTRKDNLDRHMKNDVCSRNGDSAPKKRNGKPLSEQLYQFLKGKKKTMEELSDKFDTGIKNIRKAIDELRNRGVIIDVIDDKISLGKEIASPSEPIDIPVEVYKNRWIQFGVISDAHLNSKYERQDVLNHAYDIFEKEGVKVVLNPGNIIDGYGRLNQFEVFHIGTDDQVRYLLEHYPQRKDITTYFCTGMCHEGWIVKREHIDIGKHIELTAKDGGRDDLKFLGHIEADVKVKIGKRPTRIRIFHPGGGSAYSLSYKPQKIIESLQGGQKPDIMIVGHYHKLGYFQIRNVHVFLAGCAQDQSPFMRSRHIAAHVGFWIIRAHIAPDGSVNMIDPRCVQYYDKDYYTGKSWERSPFPQEETAEWTYVWE